MACEAGWLPTGLCVLGVPDDLGALGALDGLAPRVVTGSAVNHARLGSVAVLTAPAEAPAVLVIAPRAKALARDWLAQAVRIAPRNVVLDGQKTEGIDSLIKDLRTVPGLTLSDPLAKAHGKVLHISGDLGALDDWAAPPPAEVAPGLVTRVGIFSADGIDPASAMLAGALPALKGQGADLGAGWGFLARAVLDSAGVTRLHLVEDDHAALDCARRNVPDPRAHVHWADATLWNAPAPLDFVVMNPPFHSGRAADPDLGRAFIRAAQRLLAPSGRLCMVANRHLPYEATLAESFAETAEVTGDARFKVFFAARPLRAGHSGLSKAAWRR